MEKTAPINILLVDDQKSSLASLVDGLKGCDGTLCILTAENGDRVLQVLASNPVDLVVTPIGVIRKGKCLKPSRSRRGNLTVNAKQKK